MWHDSDKVLLCLPGVHPALIAGLASRESRGGSLLDAAGYGDGGRAYGIMQVTETFARTCVWPKNTCYYCMEE